MASETKKRKRASRAKAKAKQTRLQRAGHTTFVPDTDFFFDIDPLGDVGVGSGWGRNDTLRTYGLGQRYSPVSNM
ncbi:hypothetical protein DND36_29920 [Pseudomonas savastanoi pv. glycinea]|uniref:hypothetical protein n=1 Tax=Pseudomonas savastanoi TaxID=29438 RepID=UPI000D8F3D94|nr:hypothetical protein [Pseudomonas savastanoi]MCQ3008338.1 hypothetical protein [Pseudomonas savastanoi]PYD12926.1 hypothetical protein DND36_29920 [Pseudomonas savastanoi pv. glycinea]